MIIIKYDENEDNDGKSDANYFKKNRSINNQNRKNKKAKITAYKL